MVWHDEFDSTAIDRHNWVFDTGTMGGTGWGNNELEYYTDRPENSKVENGNLVITARKEKFGGCKYTSARLKTLGLRSFTYGRIEARVKLPGKQGLWPGFWMLGQNMDTIGFPFCGEVDIMEYINDDPTLHGSMHWGKDNHLQSYTGSTQVNNVNDYHVYSVEWDPTSITWYVDGVKYWEGEIDNPSYQTGAFHKPFFLLLNLAVGGDWPGKPSHKTHLPQSMYVDYVRVYERIPDAPKKK